MALVLKMELEKAVEDFIIGLVVLDVWAMN